jgi:hypothetical protein
MAFSRESAGVRRIAASSKYPHDIIEVIKNGFYHFFNFELSAFSYELNCGLAPRKNYSFPN